MSEGAARRMRSLLAAVHFRPKLADCLAAGYSARRLPRRRVAGITVGVVALPLAMAFAIASGVPPQAGIFTAIIAGFLISLLGGSRVQIGGPTGAYIVIVYGIVAQYGLANLAICTIAAGVLLCHGRDADGRPHPLHPGVDRDRLHQRHRVLILLSQVKDFLGLDIAMPEEFFTRMRAIAASLGKVDPVTLAVAVHLPGHRCGSGRNRSPPAAASSRPRPGTSRAEPGQPRAVARSRLPQHHAPRPPDDDAPARPDHRARRRLDGGGPARTSTWRRSARASAASRRRCPPSRGRRSRCPRCATSWRPRSRSRCWVPSSRCSPRAWPMRMIDDRHDPNQELMAQGVANIVAPFFGGIPATGAIARTATNVRSGARTPIAGIVHALTLLAIVLMAAPLAKYIPLAALSAVLVIVALNMGGLARLPRPAQVLDPVSRGAARDVRDHGRLRPHARGADRPRRWPACSSSTACRS